MSPSAARRRLGVALLSVAGLSACRQAPTLAPPVADLVGLALSADSSRGLVLFGTAAAVNYAVSGVRPAALEGETPSAWLERSATLSLPPAARGEVAVLDLEPAPGVTRPRLTWFVRGRPGGKLELQPGRRRYRLDLPAEPEPRVRRLRLDFTQATPAGVAARLYSLLLTGPDDPLLGALDGPPALTLTRAGGRARLTQHGTGSLRYALRLPASAELRLQPFLDRASAPALLRVSVADERGSSHELWQQRLAPGQEGTEQRLALPGAAGELCLLELSLEPARGGLPLGGWIGPVLAGRGDAGDLFPPPQPLASPERPDGAEALRDRLAGGNVVLVIFDAARADRFGCYGHPRRTTPVADRLAAEGVLFERARTAAVITLSAMPSLWTSLYPDAHHAGVPDDAPLPRQALTVAEVLAGHGVATAGFVANTNAGSARGLERGFGEFHELHLEQGTFSAGAFDRVLPGWLAAHRDQRFFLYVHFREPHFPYDAPPPFDTLFGPDAPLHRDLRWSRDWVGSINSGVLPAPAKLAHLGRLYDGNLAFADQQLGVLRQRLEQLSLLERTTLVLTADHGEALYEHGWIGHNAQLYEESLRIPLIVRFPAGRGPAGQRVTTAVDLVDLGPTLLDLFGLQGRGGSAGRFEGRSLLPVLLGAPGRPALLAFSEGSFVKGQRPAVALTHGRYKYVLSPSHGGESLYDLEQDPRERDDARGRLPLRTAWYRQELRRRLQRTLGATGAARSAVALSPEQRESLKALGYIDQRAP